MSAHLASAQHPIEGSHAPQRSPDASRADAPDAPDANLDTAKKVPRPLPDTSESDLPPLPADSSVDFSLQSPNAHADSGLNDDSINSDGSAVLERHVKKRLMDIESSFIPDASPTGNASAPAPGADDTYLFGGSPGRTRQLTKTPAIPEEGESELQSATPSSAYKTPHPAREDTNNSVEADDSQDTSKLSTMLSSPTAAAMERNLNRVTSTNRRDAYTSLDSQLRLSSSRGRDNLRRSNAEGAGNFGVDLESGDTGSAQSSKRPGFLQSRHSTQRSSVSSIAERSDASDGTDVTVGADFALQSGGALPTSSSEQSIPSLSRLPSLASMSSSLTSSHSDIMPQFSRTRSSTSTTGMAIETALGRLDEEDRDSQPATPRTATIGAPTDTVIAQHVQNIHVPETVAREYREKHASTRSPERRHAISLSYSSRSKHNLTLKEQNSKIDKLSKENFDLKLKIHFLDQALQNRSDEGVKDMINKNVQLQTDLANEKKESQALRRKVRELERKLKVQEEQPEKQRSGQSEDDERSDSDDDKAELEEEVIYLKEVMLQMHTEVDRLREETLNKEVEKRRLAEYVKSMGDIRSSETAAGMEETIVRIPPLITIVLLILPGNVEGFASSRDCAPRTSRPRCRKAT
jgi:Centrosomin N-terminal motif 1